MSAVKLHWSDFSGGLNDQEASIAEMYLGLSIPAEEIAEILDLSEDEVRDALVSILLRGAEAMELTDAEDGWESILSTLRESWSAQTGLHSGSPVFVSSNTSVPAPAQANTKTPEPETRGTSNIIQFPRRVVAAFMAIAAVLVVAVTLPRQAEFRSGGEVEMLTYPQRNQVVPRETFREIKLSGSFRGTMLEFLDANNAVIFSCGGLEPEAIVAIPSDRLPLPAGRYTIQLRDKGGPIHSQTIRLK